jgi:hypothetical protein
MTDRIKLACMAIIIALGIVLSLWIGAQAASSGEKSNRLPWQPWSTTSRTVHV